ncbi:MAG: hypothetical protein K2O52_01715 [Oscillospiraceae bacterium]|nr:hypothetical protein [Oscillospiraceae bacterium]
MKKIYQNMNTQIQPDEKLIQAILTRQVRKKHPVWNTFAVLTACAVFSMGSVSVLAYANEDFKNMLYQISPRVGAVFSPVMKSDVQNGIEMTVEGVHIDGDDAEFYITFQDLEDNRVDAEIDLMDSYSIIRPFYFDASSSGCVREGYDEQSGKMRFHIITHEPGAGKFWGDSLTFFVKEILIGAERQDYTLVDIDLSQVNYHPETISGEEFFQNRGYGGGGKYGLPELEQVTIMKPEYKKDFIQEIKLTGLAWKNGILHIQNYVENWNGNTFIGYYLEDENGNQIEECYAFNWRDGTGEYMESFFEVKPEELQNYQVYADYRVGGELIEGNWKVKFPIVQNE